MCKALQIYDAEPSELLVIYRRLKERGVTIVEELIKDQETELEVRMIDPTDRMFNPRG